MGAVATFNYTAFIAAYPEFAAIPEPTVEAVWETATILHANDGSGPVKTEKQQAGLLNMVLAHMLALSFKADGSSQPANQPVGAVASANEGSVSVSFQSLGTSSPSQAWWLQTRYGGLYWMATAPYRTMHYRVPARAALANRASGPFGTGWPRR